MVKTPNRRSPYARIVWVAVAEARGHLMRAHLLRESLAARNIQVDIVTTSMDGQAFLTAMGSPSTVLEGRCSLAFDARQNIHRGQVQSTVLRYLFASRDAHNDLHTLRSLCNGATLLINDFHTLPLLMPQALGVPVVHLHGEHLWDSIEHHFDGHAPAVMDRALSSFLRARHRRAAGSIVHSLRPDTDAPNALPTLTLPPVLPTPKESPEAVRARLGITAGRKLAAVYLNPIFRDEALAAAIEDALSQLDFSWHAVGEGFGHRRGWRACDPDFASVSATADVLIAPAGMGTLSQAWVFQTPYLALTTQQPEQQRNLTYLKLPQAPRSAVVDGNLDGEAIASQLVSALKVLTHDSTQQPRPCPIRAATAVRMQWTNALQSLVDKHRPPRTSHANRTISSALNPISF